MRLPFLIGEKPRNNQVLRGFDSFDIKFSLCCFDYNTLDLIIPAISGTLETVSDVLSIA